MDRKLMSGTFWLSFGSIFSRILGILYFIPWLYMLGSKNNRSTAQALFNTAYVPYGIFMQLATAGFPSAIARRVASYNGAHKFNNSKQFTRICLVIMLISGFICGSLLFILAPMIARFSPVVSTTNATIAIRLLVPEIFIIPSMNAFRGWFQGNQDLKPYGISQLWEQLIRILFILGSTFTIIYVWKMNFVNAVYTSVFAAVLGAIASYTYLLLYYRKQRPIYDQLSLDSANTDLHNISTILRIIIVEAIPFVIVDTGINFGQLIDQFFFKQIIVGVLHFSQQYAQYLYTLFSANPSKITNIIVVLAIAVAETSLPVLSQHQADKNFNSDINSLIVQNLSLLLVTLLPAITILCALSREINGLIFYFDPLGSQYLFWNIVQSFILGMTINSLTLLLALHYSKEAVIYLFLGLGIKLLLQFPLIRIFQGFGAMIATGIGFIIITLMALLQLKKDYHIQIRSVLKIVNWNILYFVMIITFSAICSRFFLTSTKFWAFIYCVVVGLISLGLYILLLNQTGLAEKLFQKKLSLTLFREHQSK